MLRGTARSRKNIGRPRLSRIADSTWLRVTRGSGLEVAVHDGPRRPGFARETQCLPHLSEDFAFPERKRVESRGDAKEMACRIPSKAVEAGALELRLVQAAPLREIPRQPVADAFVRREAVDLAAVA